MTQPRTSYVDVEATPYYHLVSRCVRRAFLCGRDPYTGQDYSHRKAWMLERLRALGEVFAVEICAYAIMSNHVHLVIRVDAEAASAWSDDEVLERYEKLFKSARASLRLLPADEKAARLALFRARLSSVSWLMRCFNEHIARRANREDECTGRFWEGRFKSQPLLDMSAVLTCMSYVDLNPVRAGAAASLETAEFTSIHERLAAMDRHVDARANEDEESSTLVPFVDEIREDNLNGEASEPLPMTLVDYAELLEWTGHARLGGKTQLSGPPPALLTRLRIDPREWLAVMAGSGLRYYARLGSPERLDAEAERLGCKWVRGKGVAKRLFARAA